MGLCAGAAMSSYKEHVHPCSCVSTEGLGTRPPWRLRDPLRDGAEIKKEVEGGFLD